MKQPVILLVLNPDDMIVTRYVKVPGQKVFVSHRGLLHSNNPQGTLNNFRTDPPDETKA